MSEYIIGKYYRVPTVRATVSGIERDWPIIGPLHDDKELIGFAHKHYHIDWRFVPDRVRYKIGGFRHYKPAMRRIYGMVIYNRDDEHRLAEDTPIVFKRLRRSKFDQQFPFLESHARHETGVYPEHKETFRHTFPDLQHAYRNASLGPHQQCPHKGASLESVEPVCGVIVCPLHGICFDAASGKAISPQEAEQRINEQIA